MCLIIFFARCVDVSFATIRLILVAKSKKKTASLFAFMSIFMWFLVAREAITTDITSFWIPISYASGFAIGTYIGLLLSDYFISDFFTINVISSKINNIDIETIKNNGYGISYLQIEDDKKLLILQIKKKYLNEAQNIIKALDNNAFIMINETKYVEHGYLK